MNRTLVLGTGIDTVSRDGAIKFALSCMEERRGAYAVTPNAEIVLAARRDRKLREALRASALSLPDGVGVVLAARILGAPVTERIAGIDFAEALLSRLPEKGKSVFLLGGRAGVAARAADELLRRCPSLRIVGTEDGFFDRAREGEIFAEINAASPDLLLVCLGSPRQELWMHENAARLRVGLMIGLGGALDVLAGDLRRAPEDWRRRGFEWLFRLLQQPERLERVLRLPRIVFLAFWNRIGGEKENG